MINFIFTKSQPSPDIELNVASPCVDFVDIPADLDFDELASQGIDSNIVYELVYLPYCKVTYDQQKDATKVEVMQIPSQQLKDLIAQIGFVMPSDSLEPRDGFKTNEKSDGVSEKKHEEYL